MPPGTGGLQFSGQLVPLSDESIEKRWEGRSRITVFRPPPTVFEHRWKPPTTRLLHPNIGTDLADDDLRMTPIPPPILPGPLPTRRERIGASKNARLAVNLRWKGGVTTVPNSWNFLDSMPLTGLYQRLRKKKKPRRREGKNFKLPRAPRPPLELNSSPKRNFIELIENVEEDYSKGIDVHNTGKSLGDEPGRGKQLLLLASTAAEQMLEAEKKDLSYSILRKLYEVENQPKKISTTRIRSAVHRLSPPRIISTNSASTRRTPPAWNTSVLCSPITRSPKGPTGRQKENLGVD